jgi:hypothetical protein
MNNVVFGKNMADVRKRFRLDLVDVNKNADKQIKLQSDIIYARTHVINDCLIGIQRGKEKVKFPSI